jgi:hypothetical protein
MRDQRIPSGSIPIVREGAESIGLNALDRIPIVERRSDPEMDLEMGGSTSHLFHEAEQL